METMFLSIGIGRRRALVREPLGTCAQKIKEGARPSNMTTLSGCKIPIPISLEPAFKG